MMATASRALVICPEGHRYYCERSALGGTIRCPRCGRRFKLRERRPDEKVPARDGACPVCASTLPDDAIICVQCGFDTTTGRTLTTKNVDEMPGTVDARAGFYARLERVERLFFGSFGLLALFLAAGVAAFCGMARESTLSRFPFRNAPIFDVLGWRGTWLFLALFLLSGAFFVGYQLFSTGKVEIQLWTGNDGDE